LPSHQTAYPELKDNFKIPQEFQSLKMICVETIPGMGVGKDEGE
jgi:hypothetical protein